MLASTCESVCVASAAGVGTRTSLVASPQAATLMSCLVRTTAPGITPWPRLLENRSVFSSGESLMTSRNVAGRRTGTHERGRRTVKRLLCLPLTGPIGSRGLPGIRDGAHRRVAAPPPGPGPVAAHSATPAGPSPAISVSASDCSSRRTSTGSPADADLGAAGRPREGRQDAGYSASRGGHGVPGGVRRASVEEGSGARRAGDAVVLVHLGTARGRQDASAHDREEHLAPL